MKPKSTAELLAERQQQRKAASRPSAIRPVGAPMFASVGRDQPRASSRSRVVLALASVGVGLGTLSLMAQLFGWGRPEAPVRVHMMGDEAEAAAAAIARPPVVQAPAADPPSPPLSSESSSGAPRPQPATQPRSTP